jgi:undecaprenyl-diphosphatase
MMSAVDALDRQLLIWLRAYQVPWLDAATTWISAAGGAGLVWLALAAVALGMPRHRAAAWRVMLAIFLSYALVDVVIKPLVARARPTLAASGRELPPTPASHAFPSGHATASFSAAVTVSRMWPGTRALWWALAVLIGYSRIYLGHHYPLDIVGGAILGTLVAMWVLGGRSPATYASTLPKPLPAGVIVKP